MAGLDGQPVLELVERLGGRVADRPVGQADRPLFVGGAALREVLLASHLAAGESGLPLVRHPCEIVGLWRHGLGGGVVEPPILAAGVGVDARPDHCIPVALVNELDVFAGAGRPTQPWLYTKPADTGYAVVAGCGDVGGRQWPEFLLKLVQGVAAGLAAVVINIDPDDTIGHVNADVAGPLVVASGFSIQVWIILTVGSRPCHPV